MKLINPELRIENTSRCNAYCKICPREKMTRPKVTMDICHFKKLVREGKKLGAQMVSIFGYGEPLVDLDVAEKVLFCTRLNLQTNITTNAALLDTKTILELLKAGLSQIRFSVHGFGTNYEKVHRGLRWHKVISNINEFIAANNVYGHKCETHVTVIPMCGENVNDIVNRWQPGNYVDYLEVWRPHDWAGGRNYRKVVRKKDTCGRPFRGPVQIMADGKMIVCCFDFNGEMVVGDTKEQTIEQILQGAPFESIRKKHRTADHAGLLCEFCDQLNEYDDNPLLYSNRDKKRELGKTSSFKIHLEEN